MRIAVLLLTMTLAAPSLAGAADAPAPNTPAQTVTRLDLAEAEAVQRGDFDALEKLWSREMTVNNPFNQVVKASGGRVRSGAVTYASFVRNIESLQVLGDTAIAMGNEVVVPSGSSPGAGTTIRRRYTNVWMKRDGGWQLTARHANVICPS